LLLLRRMRTLGPSSIELRYARASPQFKPWKLSFSTAAAIT
jgi:hypothetical protein